MFKSNNKVILLLLMYQKKLEKDFKSYNLHVKFNSFRYHRYLFYCFKKDWK